MSSCLHELKPAGRNAVFSWDYYYRYTLWREWTVQEISLTVAHDVDPRPMDYVQFVGLNPSTADDREDDPTIRRCTDFAKRWGYGAFCMTNLFGWRATDPKDMKRAVEPIGPENDHWLQKIAIDAGVTICCWGNHGSDRHRIAEVLALPSFHERHNKGRLCCFGVSPRSGQPKHPLMLPKLTPAVPLGQFNPATGRFDIS